MSNKKGGYLFKITTLSRYMTNNGVLNKLNWIVRQRCRAWINFCFKFFFITWARYIDFLIFLNCIKDTDSKCHGGYDNDIQLN